MNKNSGFLNIINNVFRKNQIPIINQSYETNIKDIYQVIANNYKNNEISYYYKINQNFNQNISKILDDITKSNHKHKYLFIKDNNNITDLYSSKLIENLQNKDISIYKNYSIYKKSSFLQLKNDLKYFDNIGIQIDKSICFEQDSNNNYKNSKEIIENYHKMVLYVFSKINNNKNIYINFAVHNKNTEDLAKLYYNNYLSIKDLISISYMKGFDNENNLTDKTFKFISYGIYADHSPLIF